MLNSIIEIDKNQVGFFRFGELKKGLYLVTNDSGNHVFLDSENFNSFLDGSVRIKFPEKYEELKVKGFIKNELDFNSFAQAYSSKNAFLGKGANLHILVVTLRCDHKCIYCQAGAQSIDSQGLDMSIDTAKKALNFILNSPSRDITIEFQGGEPLVNWKTVEFVIGYCKKNNKNKNLSFTLVSNLSFMNEKILNYLKDNNVTICTSLDGPEKVHDRNRTALNGKSTYKNAVKWIKRIKKASKGRYIPSALTTVTRYSLPFYKEIIDEYAGLGLRSIHLRPVAPFGISKSAWERINYSAQDFIDFYKKSLKYIIDLNIKGNKIQERFTKIFLSKIFDKYDPGYLDLRSPCGASTGQLAYNFDGGVYTCDEARMLSRLGDNSFRLGEVGNIDYAAVVNNETTKVMAISSCLDNLPECSQCVYKPYCGVCPIHNYFTNKDIFRKSDFLCKVNKAVLNEIFLKLKDENTKKVFESWLN